MWSDEETSPSSSVGGGGRLFPLSHQLVEERARKCVSYTFQRGRVSFLPKFTCQLELPVSVKFRGGAQRVRPGCHGAQPLKGFETVQMTRREQEVQQ